MLSTSTSAPEALLQNLPPLNVISVSLPRAIRHLTLFGASLIYAAESAEPQEDDGVTVSWSDAPPAPFSSFATGDYVVLQQHALQKVRGFLVVPLTSFV